MANKNSGKRKTSTPDREAAVDGSGESLDQVRDILFGGQMRAVDARLERLEGRLMREIDGLRKDAGSQTDTLDKFVKKELESLAGKLEAERAKRSTDLKAMAADLRDATKSLEGRLTALENSTDKADAELRDQIMTQAAAAAQQMKQLSSDLTVEFRQETDELRSEKADTASLVALFSDMALRLTDELPGSDHT